MESGLMSLVVSRNGYVLLSFEQSKQPVVPPAEKHIPLPLALVVAVHQERVLFIFNTWRQEWELPGGMIDDGEMPEAAAKRELQEETSQVALNLRLVGLAKMRLKPDDRLEFGAIYTCELEHIVPCHPNDEAARIMWWDLQSPVDDPMSEIDAKLAQMTLDFYES